MIVFWLSVIVALMLLFYYLVISCTVRCFRPEYSVGAAWWPVDGEDTVVNAPNEPVGFETLSDGSSRDLYPFSSTKKEKTDDMKRRGTLPNDPRVPTKRR